MPDQPPSTAATVTVSEYTVSRLPDDSVDHAVWSITIEASGHGRWAVRSRVGRCLNKSGEWEYEPLPSERAEEWLARTRWDTAEAAIEAALVAEPSLIFNGMTPADVLARRSA